MPHGLREPLRLPFATGEVRPKVAKADPMAGWLAAREGGGADPRMAKLAADLGAQEAARLERDAGGPE